MVSGTMADLRLETEWTNHFELGVRHVTEFGGVAHLWLHSWELDAYDQWATLAGFLRHLKSDYVFRVATNAECSLVTNREFSLHTKATTSTGSVRVLYIGGEGRSGSTVLATILGSYPDIVTIGEFRLVWQALKRNLLCGCGTPVLACPFWSQVGDVAFGGWNSFDVNEMMRADARYVRHCYIPRHIALRSRRDSADLRDFRQALGQLYLAIGQVSGARTLSTRRRGRLTLSYYAMFPRLTSDWCISFAIVAEWHIQTPRRMSLGPSLPMIRMSRPYTCRPNPTGAPLLIGK